ncbi:AsnC family transcriptional regulator [Brevibacterium sp. 'Marine']|uniref:Lrp/AsnC family transcriptional regulator n=1 Tax=Brevibacterium sp. 'Marine' TaxID=2725563 RepID=UPI00145E7AA7|nr:AsnC family transcriptional regulator [Brevibacterium sp. 'Marine']
MIVMVRNDTMARLHPHRPRAGKSGESAVLDEVDRKIVAALQVAPRASWARVANVLELSESVVFRRGKKLLDSEVVQVSALPDPTLTDRGFPVLVRLRCEVGEAYSVARAMAARPDTRLVLALAASYDVLVELIVPTRHSLGDVLQEGFKDVSGIVESESATVIRNFKTSFDWARASVGSDLSQLDEKRACSELNRTVDESDLKIIEILAGNGRLSYKTVGEIAGLSESSVRRRVDALLDNGAFQFATYVEPDLLGFNAPLFVWFDVDARDLEGVAARLSALPEVRYVSATTGKSQLAAEILSRGIDDIYDLTTSEILGVDDVKRVDVGLEVRSFKRGFMIR